MMIPSGAGVAIVLLLAKSVAAQSSPPIFELSPTEQGQFANWCLFSLLYIILTVFSIKAFRRQRYHRRLPYALILSAVSLTLFGAIFSVMGYIFEGLIMFDDGTGIRPLMAGLATFTSVWALPVQFLAIVTLFHERFRAISTNLYKPSRRLPGGKAFATLHGVIAFVMFAVGTAATGLYVYLIYMIDTRYVSYRDRIPRFEDINMFMLYAFTAVQFCVMVDIVVLAIIVRRRLREACASDKVTNILTIALTPVYVGFTLAVIVVVIVLSPAASNGMSFEAHRGVGLTYTIVYQLLIFNVYAFLVVPGLWAEENWLVQPQPKRHVDSVEDQKQFAGAYWP